MESISLPIVESVARSRSRISPIHSLFLEDDTAAPYRNMKGYARAKAAHNADQITSGTRKINSKYASISTRSPSKLLNDYRCSIAEQLSCPGGNSRGCKSQIHNTVSPACFSICQHPRKCLIPRFD